VLVNGERAARRIPFAAPDASWTELVEEIDRLAPTMRFAVELTGEASDAVRVARVGDLIWRGYSARSADRADWAVLQPRPSGVLSIVSPLPTASELPPWISRVHPGRFRQHVLVLDASEGAFASLASSCTGESWHLDAFLPPREWAEFIVEFTGSREIDLVQVVAARLGVDLVPALRSAYPAIRVVVDVAGEDAFRNEWSTYVRSRYGNVVDAFCVGQSDIAAQLERARVPSSRIHLVGDDEGGQAEAVAARHEGVYGRLIATAVTRGAPRWS
jgi:hypothetical protein